MASVVAFCSKVIYEVVVNPAYDALTSMATLFRYHSDLAERNASTSEILTVEMSANDLQFYFIFKSTWSLLMLAIVFLAIAFSLSWLYKIFFIPYERVKRLGSIG